MHFVSEGSCVARVSLAIFFLRSLAAMDVSNTYRDRSIAVIFALCGIYLFLFFCTVQLALKHRRNKHGGQRIIIFVSSPIEDEVRAYR